MPKPIQRLAENYMQDPVKITIKVKAENSPNIQQRFIKVRQYEKREMMLRLLEIEKFDALLIFARTKNSTMEIAEALQGKGYPAEPLNGDMPQSLREKTVDRLKRGKINILVATDVAARGLDVDRISHVLNFDAPFRPRIIYTQNWENRPSRKRGRCNHLCDRQRGSYAQGNRAYAQSSLR